MNMAYKKVSALVFSVIVTMSAFGMDNTNATDIITEQSACAWYKKSSVQAAAAAVTLTVMACAYVAHTGKVVVPALVAGLVTVKTVQDLVPTLPLQDTSSEKTVFDQSQDIIVLDAVEPKLTIVGNAQVVTKEPVHLLNDMVNSMKKAIENLTAEDLQQINEELVR